MHYCRAKTFSNSACKGRKFPVVKNSEYSAKVYFLKVLHAAASNCQRSRAIVTVLPNNLDGSNVTTIACNSGYKEPVDLCLWERTSPDEPSEIIMVDSGAVHAANHTCPGGFICADGSELDQGKCGLTVRSDLGQIIHWSCTLITDEGRLYYATVNVTGKPQYLNFMEISSLFNVFQLNFWKF